MLPLTTSQRQTLSEAVQAYEMELAGTAGVLAQLEARGLTRETISSARLGAVSTEPWPGHQGMIGWLVIPYLDKDGEPLTMRFRCTRHESCKAEGHKAKYMSLPNDPARTYNIGAIHRAARGVGGDSSIHICEGELDALVLTQIGLHAIAIPGAQGWRPRHRVMLAGFNEVYVWSDPDEAGDKFGFTVMRSIRQARQVRLTAGDVNETYLASGAEGLLAALKGEA